MFVHLNVHSDNSVLDGLIKVEEIVKLAKSYDMPAVALTDNANLYGVVSFVEKCNKTGIKPIIGVELQLAPRSIKNKENKIDNKTYPLIFLAKNFKGYKNLIKMITVAHSEGFFFKPRVDLDVIKKFSEGLIVLSGGRRGPIFRHIYMSNEDKAFQLASQLKDIFGGDFYIELHRVGVEGDKDIEVKLIELARNLNIELVATNDVHYKRLEDADARELVWCIDDMRLMSDPARRRQSSNQFYFKSVDEMVELFKDLPQAVENTLRIAEKVEKYSISYGKVQPRYHSLPPNHTEESFLKELVFKNAPSRFGYWNDELKNRLEYELSVIHEKGYDGYFLVIWDITNWARSKGISFNVRGSAAGSCVSYALGISSVDPIKWNLFFERFLNPERESFPDIDVDFASDRRDEVIEYVRKSYGKDCVATVGALGKLTTRAAIRDVGRVLGIELSLVNRLSELVPVVFGKVTGINAMIADEMATGVDLRNIQQRKAEVEEFRKVIKEDGADLDDIKYCNQCNLSFFGVGDESCKYCGGTLKVVCQASKRLTKLLYYVQKIEKCVRNVTTHACGYLITSPNPVIEYLPLQRKPGGGQEDFITQIEGGYFENLGLMKFDFLGLANLSIIDNTVKLVKKYKNPDFDIDKIPLDDAATYDLFKRGDTSSIFQLEVDGDTKYLKVKYLKELAPQSLEEISDMLALYRPGPMEFIPSYIRRKYGKESVEYLIPELEPIMRSTYGIPVYQEQVLQIAHQILGYSLGAADILRRAMGKKLPDVMAAEAERFKKAFLSRYPHYGEEIADKLWHYVQPFADYGFNKSHSATYALISYKTAYLKVHYTTEFYAALMFLNLDKPDKLRKNIQEAIARGITLLPPNINKSDVFFAIEGDNIIRFGIGGIKGIGLKGVEKIIEEREIKGAYNSLDDLCIRTSDKGVSKKAIEVLIKIGALDDFGKRAAMLEVLDDVYEKSKKVSKKAKTGALDMFGGSTNEIRILHSLPNVEEVSDDQKAEWEEDLLGIRITRSLIDEVSEKLVKVSFILSDELVSASVDSRKFYKMFGVIRKVSWAVTKKNDKIARLLVSDSGGSFIAIFFPSVLANYNDLQNINEGNYIFIKGVKDNSTVNPNSIVVREFIIIRKNEFKKFAEDLLNELNYNLSESEFDSFIWGKDKANRDFYSSENSDNFKKVLTSQTSSNNESDKAMENSKNGLSQVVRDLKLEIREEDMSVDLLNDFVSFLRKNKSNSGRYRVAVCIKSSNGDIRLSINLQGTFENLLEDKDNIEKTYKVRILS